ncbi:MAG: biopolymer transporter ExbD [Acidobacteria bacterium]|nr:biopolymer transporter ExbD [Acidobacteriota bacterium]
MNTPNINVTPLIDVLLVLLIIFMVIAPAKPTAFQAKIPSVPNKSDDVRPNPNALIVTINPDHTLVLNREDGQGTIEDSDRIVARLREVFADRTNNGIFRYGTNEIEKTVFIKAPKKLDYGSVARIVDAVKVAGAAPIGLQIDELQ